MSYLPVAPDDLVLAVLLASARKRAGIVQLGLGVGALVVGNAQFLAPQLPGVQRIVNTLPFLLTPVVSLVGSGLGVVFIVWGLYQLVASESPGGSMGRRLERSGDLRGAGEVYLQAGDRKKAKALFIKARAWSQAARLETEDGKQKAAAMLLRRAGGRHLSDAALLFRELGEYDGARQCDIELAEWHAKERRFVESLEAWLRAGDKRRARRAAALAIQEGRLVSAHPLFGAVVGLAGDLDDHAFLGELLEMKGDLGAAGAAWREADNFQQAAQCFRRAGLLEDAADAESRAGREEEAVKLEMQLFDRLRSRLTAEENRGQVGEITLLQAKLTKLGERLIPRLREHGLNTELIRAMRGVGQVDEAVNRLIAAGELDSAAELAHEAQRWDLAGDLLEKLRRWGEASDVHEIAGDLKRAGRCAVRAGEDERALQIFRRVGDVGETASCLARLGRMQEGLTELHGAGLIDEAAQLLRKFPGPVPDIPEVVLDMAEWLKTNASLEEAIACLQRAVLGVALHQTRLGPALALARLLFEAGDLEAAKGQIDRILDFDYACEPAQTLKKKIKDSSRAPVATRPSEGAEDSAPSLLSSVEQRYEIGNQLGQGGMGVVYHARDTRLERDVAIKVLRTTSDAEAARLEQEAKAAATLSHPGIVTVFDFEAGFGGFFIVMEQVVGVTLDKLLRTDAQRVKDNLLRLLVDLIDVVAYAHRHHVIHRDLKPGNVMMTPANEVKILDFGIAARLDTPSGFDSGVCGTPYYMSPEQIRGEAPTPASDIYSFGATAYHLATGRPPFKRGNVIDAHLKVEPQNPVELAPALDPRLAEVILRCLKKEPVDRFSTATELHTELRRLIVSS